MGTGKVSVCVLVDDAIQKLQYDLFYIKNQSLTLDIVIVFDTIKTVLFGLLGHAN